MISLFRRELGKIKYVLCIVLLGFAIPSFLRRGGSSRRESIVARVNGEPISFIEFDRVSKEMESYYQMLSAQFGIPFNYKANEHEVIRRCATEKLTDQLVDSVNLQLDENYFNEQLYNSFLKYFCDESGRVNMEAYQRYLTKINMKINEFEEGQERQLKRSIVGDFVRNAFYSPSYLAKALHDQETMHKKFAVVTLSLDKFLANERHAAASEADLQKYYQIHQEEYRVAEKRKAAYALINPAHLAAGLTVDSEAVENYYSRNKDQFRVPVKIKLRRLVFGSAVAHVDAEAIYAQVKEKPSEFVHFIKTHSVDKDGAAKGGLTGYISKGSIDPQVEEVAFKLKEKGELSELIRTRNGLELVQLEDRIASHEKSFAEVKSEVAQFLIARKAAQHIKSRIDAMNRQIHDGESSEKAFANLCHDMKLSVVESGWLSAHDASGKGLANLLATALFKKGEKLGSFMHEESHVVFLAKGAEKSFIPSFEKIAGKVTEDCRQARAHNNLKKVAEEMRHAVLSNKLSLDEVAKSYGFSVVATGKVKKNDVIALFKGIDGLNTQAFELTDPSQLLKVAGVDGYHLIQLLEQPEAGSASSLQIENISGEVAEQGRKGYFDSFIASLLRTVKIEYEKTIETSAPNE